MAALAQLGVRLYVQNNEPAGSGDNNVNEAFEFVSNFLSGLGLEAIDRVFMAKRASFTSTPTDYDLNTYTDRASGSALAMAKACLILVVNHSTTGNLVVGGDTNALLFGGAAAHTITVPPLGMALLVSRGGAYTVTASTGDVLQIAASAGTVVGSVVVLGRSS